MSDAFESTNLVRDVPQSKRLRRARTRHCSCEQSENDENLADERDTTDNNVPPPSEETRFYLGSPSDAETDTDDETKNSFSMETYRSSSGSDGSDTDAESQNAYRHGGYHVISSGDIFKNRYHVLKKLGWGHFSTVWLCHDALIQRYCAVKVVKSGRTYRETARDELELLRELRKYDSHQFYARIIDLRDEFNISGVNGTHQCMVFEAMGDTLLTLIQRSNYKGLPLVNLKQIVKQVLEGLAYMHKYCKMIHTDLKPENVLIASDDIDLRIQANFACNQYMARIDKTGNYVLPDTNAQYYSQSQSRSDGVKLSKTAKKRIRCRNKRAVNFFKCHRTMLRRKGIEDLLSLARRGLLTYAMAAAGVTNQLPFLPFDNYNILCDDDLLHLEQLECQHQQLNTLPDGVVAAMAKSMLMESRIGATPAGFKIHSQAYKRTKYGPGKHYELDKSATSILQHVYKLLLKSSDMCKLLISSPKNFIKHIKQLIEAENFNCSGYCKPNTYGHHYKKRKPTNVRSKFRIRYECAEPVKEPSESSLNLFNRKDPAKHACRLSIKIVDMGNACWDDYHFTEDIQTREYRALEVILSAGYTCAADIWSAACMFWELATGDFLFNPNARQGDANKDAMHLATIVETCGCIPQDLLNGYYRKDLVKANGTLRDVHDFKRRDLNETLVNDHKWEYKQARSFVEFLMPMLDTNPATRRSAIVAMNDEYLNLSQAEMDEIDDHQLTKPNH